jgi:hypothetical protein
MLSRRTAPCACIRKLITEGSPACPRNPAAGYPRALQPAVPEQIPRTCRPAMYRPGGGPDSEHAAEYQGASARPCYSYCMISPIRGNFPAPGVQVPPRTHQDERLTCGYAMGRHSPELGTGCFRRSGPWGAIRSRLRNDNGHRRPDRLADLRVRRGWMPVSGSRAYTHWPTAATPSTPQTRHYSERRHVGFPAKAQIAEYDRLLVGCRGSKLSADRPFRRLHGASNIDSGAAHIR